MLPNNFAEDAILNKVRCDLAKERLASTKVHKFSCCACENLFSYTNYPIILLCEHRICINCLKSCYDTALDAHTDLEIICMTCINNNKSPAIYPIKNCPFERFMSIMFWKDYSLIAVILNDLSSQQESALGEKKPMVSAGIYDMPKVGLQPGFQPATSIVVPAKKTNPVIEKRPEDKPKIIPQMPAKLLYEEEKVPVKVKEPPKANAPMPMPLSQHQADLDFPVDDIEEPMVKLPPMGSKPEKKVEADIKNGPSDIQQYVNLSVGLNKAFACAKCMRLFNIRNYPFQLPCVSKHTICEFCMLERANRIWKANLIIYNCPMDVYFLRKTVTVSPHYPLGIFLRMHFVPDKKLLAEIYSTHKEIAMKAENEFVLGACAQHTVFLQEIFCCQSCKNQFIPGKLDPFLLLCGHSTCLKCAEKNLLENHNETIICGFCKGKHDIKGDKKNLKKPEEILKSNAELISYIMDCNNNNAKIFGGIPAKTEVCPLCEKIFNDGENFPYFSCANSHLICKSCLKERIIKHSEGKIGEINIPISCPNCDELVNVKMSSEKNIESGLACFKKREIQ